MNTAQVAVMQGIPSIKTVQAMVREGRIPAHRLPGARRYRFLREEIVGVGCDTGDARPE
jgi:excisionase family DNA binding protein